MSMPIRSHLDTGLIFRNTAVTVGPGSYRAHGVYHVPQSKAPFSSTSSRGLLSRSRRDNYNEYRKEPQRNKNKSELIRSPSYGRLRPATAHGDKSKLTSRTQSPSPSDHDKETPYLAPSKKYTPGPGSYGTTRRTWLSLYDQYEKRAIMSRGKEHVGFSSTSERDCLKEKQVWQPPGPGSYSPQIFEKEHHARAESAFGSTAPRRTMFEASQPAPAPGDYSSEGKKVAGVAVSEYAQKMSQLHGPTPSNETNFYDNSDHNNSNSRPSKFVQSQMRRRPQNSSGSSVFQSATKQISTKAATSLCVGNEVGPGVGSYEVRDQRKKLYQHRNHGGFDSTADRFDRNSVFANQSMSPGPGSYNINTENKSLMNNILFRGKSKPFLVSATRFDGPGAVYERPASKLAGPGKYNVAGSMVKKSYNITMAGKSDKKTESPVYKDDRSALKIGFGIRD